MTVVIEGEDEEVMKSGVRCSEYGWGVRLVVKTRLPPEAVFIQNSK